MDKISIVIPVFFEQQNLHLLFKSLERVTGGIDDTDWDFVFVNDGSEDGSMDVLLELAQSDNRIKIIDLSRNFGKEIALTAGVHEINGMSDAVICMDADMQHPPELIPKLIEEWRKGAEIVATVRTSIEKQPLLRRMGSHLYYWLMNKISGVKMVSQTTDFRLYDRKVIAAFCLATERERMFRGIMDWLGFRKTYIEFAANARNDGQVGYSYKKLWSLAINSITSFSLWPLRLTGYLGVVITSISTLLSLWMVGSNIFSKDVIYTPLAIVVVANTFLIGVVLMAIGLVALYIGNIHTEVINRPLYIIRDRINLDKEIKPGPEGD